MAEKATRALRPAPAQGQRGLVPFQEMERMERMFEDFFRRPYSLLSPSRWLRSFPEMEEEIPAVTADVFEEGDNLVVKAEIPGISKEDVEISFSDNIITIRGEKRKEEKVENRDYYRLERSYGSFSENIYLPVEVDSEKASASFRDGVLEIRIPKMEESQQKAKKITIQ